MQLTVCNDASGSNSSFFGFGHLLNFVIVSLGQMLVLGSNLVLSAQQKSALDNPLSRYLAFANVKFE
jgi:hypothetical protein